ncbi:MAG: LytTR family DNA-binding domain-containing protein [Saprospiraceae bacterium]
MKTALLIDDELNSLDVLEYELKHFKKDIRVIGTCSDPRMAKTLINSLQPEVVFLDIEMPWMNGFELLESLGRVDFQLIFVTSYGEFAIKAFEYFALDYLLKPISRSTLEKALSKIQHSQGKAQSSEYSDLLRILQRQQKEIKKIALPVRNGYEFYHHDEIVRCEADANYTKVYFQDNNSILVSKPLKAITAMLSGANFFRPHQSHLINLNYIRKFDRSDGGVIIMQDKSNIPISRHKKALFIDLIKGW